VANPALLPDAVEESLRFNTSAQRFRRRLMKDVDAARPDHEGRRLRLPGLRLGQPRRTPVPRPRRYDITRKPRGHLGFGGGVHACLGTAIARMSVKIAFEEFHKVVPRYRRVAGPTGVDALVHLPQPAAAGSGGLLSRQTIP
jgi:cytochrome P450